MKTAHFSKRPLLRTAALAAALACTSLASHAVLLSRDLDGNAATLRRCGQGAGR